MSKAFTVEEFKEKGIDLTLQSIISKVRNSEVSVENVLECVNELPEGLFVSKWTLFEQLLHSEEFVSIIISDINSYLTSETLNKFMAFGNPEIVNAVINSTKLSEVTPKGASHYLFMMGFELKNDHLINKGVDLLKSPGSITSENVDDLLGFAKLFSRDGDHKVLDAVLNSLEQFEQSVSPGNILDILYYRGIDGVSQICMDNIGQAVSALPKFLELIYQTLHNGVPSNIDVAIKWVIPEIPFFIKDNSKLVVVPREAQTLALSFLDNESLCNLIKAFFEDKAEETMLHTSVSSSSSASSSSSSDTLPPPSSSVTGDSVDWEGVD